MSIAHVHLHCIVPAIVSCYGKWPWRVAMAEWGEWGEAIAEWGILSHFWCGMPYI